VATDEISQGHKEIPRTLSSGATKASLTTIVITKAVKAVVGTITGALIENETSREVSVRGLSQQEETIIVAATRILPD